MTIRCTWVGHGKPYYDHYHDTEWGVPSHDDRHLFEMLILEGAQAGLSWDTILRKRDGYRKAFHGFDVTRVAAMTDTELEQALATASIVRNRLKVFATRKNARIFQTIQTEFGTFNTYLWRFVNGQPIINHWPAGTRLPATTPESDALSRDLKKRGMTFVGSTIMYAYMQAVGMVNDHTTNCFRYRPLSH